MRTFLALCFGLSCATASLAQQNGAWTTSDGEGAPIATWSANAGGPELVSFACDLATREILVFRAADPSLHAPTMSILTASGEMRLEAEADSEGEPGMVARTAATEQTIAMLSNAATLTISIGEAGKAEGLAVPVEQPLRDVLDGCVSR